MKCPSCSKFASLEMQDPEVNNLSLEGDGVDREISFEVRIVRNSECCGDEMKEYTFSDNADPSDEISDKIAEILSKDPEAEFDVEEDSVSQVEEGGGRYKKSYYGFTLSVKIVQIIQTRPRTKEEQDELDSIQATFRSGAAMSDELNKRRLELLATGRPRNEELGVVEISDKVAASEMDELN